MRAGLWVPLTVLATLACPSVRGNARAQEPNQPVQEAPIEPAEGQLSARAEIAAPVAPAERIAGAREVIELRKRHGDSFSAVESAPGALPVFSGVPYLLIRGAPPAGTATLYDGAPIPAFHHLALGPAIAHLSLVSNVRFHGGLAPARFGRRIGGVHSLDAPDTPPTTAHGEVELNAVDSQALVATAEPAWVAAHVRYGYPSVWLDAADAGVKLGYGDYQIRSVHPLGPGLRATVHAFGAYDSLGETAVPEDDIALSFHRVVGRLVSEGPRASHVAALYAGYDRGELGQELSGQVLRIGPSVSSEHVLDVDTRLRFGADLESKLVDIDYRPSSESEAMRPRIIDSSDPNSYLPPVAEGEGPNIAAAPQAFIEQSPLRRDLGRSAVGAYVELDLLQSRWMRLETGVRADLWMLGGRREQAVDPRVRMRVVPSRAIEFHAGVGTAHQAAASPLPVPGLADVELDTGLQRAVQSEVGLRMPRVLGMDIAVTGYLHRFDDVAFLELILDCEGNTDPRVFDERLPDFGSICRRSGLPRGDGLSYGAELLVRPLWTRRLSGFATYTLGGATAQAADGTRFTPQADVRHIANLVLGYDFGAGFAAGARVHFRSGKSAVNTFYDFPRGRFERQELRLPAFFRADVYVSYAFETALWPMTLTAGIQNATFSREATKRDCQLDNSLTVQCEIDSQPAIVLPNVGLRVEL